MKKKVIFVAFSDIQIEDWKRFSIKPHDRLEHNGIVMSKVRDLCQKYNVPALFCGDFFDDPKSLKNYTLQRSFEWLDSFRRLKIKIYAIDGNHDQCERNSLTNRSPNYIRTLSTAFPNVIDLGNHTLMHEGIYLSGVPYMTDNKDLLEAIKARVIDTKGSKHILLIHTDLPGAKEANGMEVAHQNMPTDIYHQLNKFDLTLNGHIHNPQQTFSRVWTLGATHHQRTSDSGADMGIWLIKSDLSMEFIKLNLPQFKYYEEGEEKPNDDNFYVEIPKDIPLEQDESPVFLASHSPNKLVSQYLKQVGIKSKSKKKLLLKYLTHAGE